MALKGSSIKGVLIACEECWETTKDEEALATLHVSSIITVRNFLKMTR